MSTGAQVLKFVIADFDQNWSRSVAAEGFIIYTATASQSHLAVVHEGRRGALTTYRYRVPANEAVWIVDDVISYAGAMHSARARQHGEVRQMTAGCHQNTWDSPSGKISRSAVDYAATWPEFAF